MVKNFPKRGEIYWVNLDPTIGAETQKLRPGLIISNDIWNEMSDVVIIAPITSKIKNIYPFEVAIVVQEKPGKAMVNQCRAVDKSRLTGKLGEADSEIMQAVDEAIKIVFSIS
jgi:mRNA interferase MazF